MEKTTNRRPQLSIIRRTQALALMVEGFSGPHIEKRTGVSPFCAIDLWKKAFERSFRPEGDPRILERYVEDGVRSGRPKTIMPAIEQRLLDNVTEAIPHHIQDIIRLEGGNEYKGGIEGYKRSWEGLG